jgi:hypothetical protein
MFRKKEIKKWHPYISRVVLSCLYLFVAIFLFYKFQDKILFLKNKNDFGDYWKLVWSIASSCIGFTLIASQCRFHEKIPYGAYMLYYPVILIVISSLVFSLVSIFGKTSNHFFYALSFSLCFILSFLIDQFWDLAKALIKNITKSVEIKKTSHKNCCN